MTTYKQQEKQQLIMNHYSNPKHKKNIDNGQIEIYSSRCVDTLFINYKLVDNTLREIEFGGQGCAIFLSSTDIVIDKIISKNIDDIKIFMNEYLKSISGEKYNLILLKEASIFDNAKKHLNRFECAKMIYDGIDELLTK